MIIQQQVMFWDVLQVTTTAFQVLLEDLLLEDLPVSHGVTWSSEGLL